LIYVAGLAAGWYLSRWRPWPIASPDSWIPAAGATVFILAWLAIFVAAITSFRRARTTMIPNRPAAALVMGGPYRFTRNPMYVSLAALYAGITCILNTWWPWILLPLVIATVDRAVIAREERYLSSAFPGEYAAYAARVRRWL
jgi:protein-S-isoprenylcysteine O-methyltransferase Ste14